MPLTFKDYLQERCWPGYKPAPGKTAYSKGSCVKEETLDEMDKSAPQPGRDGKVSHSTYGSRDKKGSDYFTGKEAPGKSITVKQMEKDALAILKKQGVAEAKSDDPEYEKALKRFKQGTPPIKGKSPIKPDSYWKKRKQQTEAVKDKYDEGEYDREGDMAKSDLRSIIANAKRVHDMLDDADNLPEWVQSKITLAEDYISTVANYMTSEMTEAKVDEDWQKVNRQDKTDGLSPAAVKAYRRENPGSNLQTAVTEKNPKGSRAKRRLSFCRRMKGMKSRLTSAKNSRDPDSPINKALRRWNC
jgi:hypothetical protein